MIIFLGMPRSDAESNRSGFSRGYLFTCCKNCRVCHKTIGGLPKKKNVFAVTTTWPHSSYSTNVVQFMRYNLLNTHTTQCRTITFALVALILASGCELLLEEAERNHATVTGFRDQIQAGASWLEPTNGDTPVLSADTATITPGTLSGSIRVPSSGAATYQIALELPPGTAEVSPVLALVYSSQVKQNGMFGIGWTMSGVSAIRRTGSTNLAPDLSRDAVDFDEDDRFRLDGQRLLVTAGEYGAEGSQYRTEIDSFATITAHGQLGSGPEYFIVEKKNGEKHYYGSSPTARFTHPAGEGVMIWQRQRVEDRLGNYILYNYEFDEETGEQYLSSIQYTGTVAGHAPYNTVAFLYEQRPDYVVGWSAGTRSLQRKRIHQIAISSQGSFVRAYDIQYGQSPMTGHSQIESIQIIAGETDSLAMRPTQFVWRNGVNAEDEADLQSASSSNDTNLVSVVSGDFDGDGKTDFVLGPADGKRELVSGPMQLHLSTKDFRPQELVVPEYTYDMGGFYGVHTIFSERKFLAHDFNHDGFSDILILFGDRVSSRILVSEGSGTFVETDINGNKSYTCLAGTMTTYTGPIGTPGFIQTQDCNGDGVGGDSYLSQFLTTHNSSKCVATRYHIAAQTVVYNASAVGAIPPRAYYEEDCDGDGTFVQVSSSTIEEWGQSTYWHGSLPPSPQTQSECYAQELIGIGDFDGDGFSDMMFHDTEPYQHVNKARRTCIAYTRPNGIANEAGNLEFKLSSIDSSILSDPKHLSLYVAELNGDGIADIVRTRRYGSKPSENRWLQVHLQTYLGNGDGTFGNTTGAINTPQESLLYDKYQRPLILADFNGDGLTDIVMAYTPADEWKKGRNIGLLNNPSLHIAFSTGDGRTKLVQTNLPIEGTRLQSAADLNGDGLADLTFAPGSEKGVINGDMLHFISRGNGTFTPITTNEIPSGHGRIALGDYDGDGRIEMLIGELGSDGRLLGPELFFYGFNEKNPDNITEIEDGLGQKTIISYGRVTDTDIYTLGTGAEYPLTDVVAPIQVVTSVLRDDGTRSVNRRQYAETRYRYGQARTHLGGRGYAGFGRFVTDNVTQGTITVEQFSQRFPTAGMQIDKRACVRRSGNLYDLVSHTANFDENGTLGANILATVPEVPEVVFPHYASSRQARWELHTRVPCFGDIEDTSGKYLTAPFSQEETHNTYDTQGNNVRIETRYDGFPSCDTSSGFGKIVQNEFATEVHREKGLFTHATVTHCAPGESSIHRASTFDYYPSGSPWADMLERETELGTPWASKRYTYNAFGNIETETRNGQGATNPRTQWYRYDFLGRFVEESANTLSHTTYVEYDGRFGTITRSVDPHNVAKYGGKGSPYAKVVKHDPFGRTVFEKSPSGIEQQIFFEFSNRDKAAYAVRTVTTQSPETIVHYDRLGREILTETTNLLNTTSDRVAIETHYDFRGRLLTKSEPYFVGVDYPQTTRYKYDRAGRMEEIISPNGLRTKTHYNGYTSSVTRSFREYDGTFSWWSGANYKNVFVDMRRTTVDARRKVIQVSDSLGSTLEYRYFSDGKLKEVISPNGFTASAPFVGATLFEYDDQGNKTKICTPSAGCRRSLYNGLGDLEAEFDATNRQTSYEYDEVGRLKARREPDETAHFHYDIIGNRGHMGALKFIQYGGQRIEKFFDAFGRVEEEKITIDHSHIATTFTYYDTFGRVSEKKYHSNESPSINYSIYQEYDPNSHLIALRDSEGDTWFSSPIYNEQGQVIEYTGRAGEVTKKTYAKQDHLLTNIVTTHQSSLLQDEVYTYNKIGHLLIRRDSVRELAEHFTYDRLHRLESATINPNPEYDGHSMNPSLYDHKVYTFFDNVGNPFFKSDVGYYIYNAFANGRYIPHAVSNVGAHSYQYDANGNMVRRNDATYEWTSFGKPKLMWSTQELTDLPGRNYAIEFRYGPEHQRVAQSTLLERVTSDGLYEQTDMEKYYFGKEWTRSEATTKGCETSAQCYTSSTQGHTIQIAGPSGALGYYRKQRQNGISANESRSYLMDHLGSITALLDENGVVTDAYSYDAWGKRRDAQTWMPLEDPDVQLQSRAEAGFTGHEMLDGALLVHMNGRIYEPTIGRFLSPDPYVGQDWDLQSFNRYSYINNAPLSGTDPSGYIIDWIAQAVVYAWSVASNAYGAVSGIWGVLSITSAVDQAILTGWFSELCRGESQGV